MAKLTKRQGPVWYSYVDSSFVEKTPHHSKCIVFFERSELPEIERLCEKAIEENIVHSCKHDSLNYMEIIHIYTGVACFYIHGKKHEDRMRVLNFLKENDKILRKKNGDLDVYFRFNTQTLS